MWQVKGKMDSFCALAAGQGFYDFLCGKKEFWLNNERVCFMPVGFMKY
jgi:hypothetical protein